LRLKGAKRLIKIGGVNAKYTFKHHIVASAKSENYTDMLVWILAHSSHRIEYWPPNKEYHPRDEYYVLRHPIECDFFFEDTKDAVNFKMRWINNEKLL